MEFLVGAIEKGYENLTINEKENLSEVRIRLNQPLIIYIGNSEYFLSVNGKTLNEYEAIYATKDIIEHTLALCFEHSLYLKNEELKNSYITIKGGYRVGVFGNLSYDDGKIINVRDVRYINIRIPKQHLGCSKKVVSYLIDKGSVLNTLIVSKPKKGKTTLIRDISRELSNTYKQTISIIDERNEISGQNTFDVGIRTDVISNCQKADGIIMAIRSMSPDVVVVDEIGNDEDFKYLQYARHSGVNIIATMHGAGFDDVIKKGYNEIFSRIVIIEEVNCYRFFDNTGKELNVIESSDFNCLCG